MEVPRQVSFFVRNFSNLILEIYIGLLYEIHTKAPCSALFVPFKDLAVGMMTSDIDFATIYSV
jgi:hypothetical protein